MITRNQASLLTKEFAIPCSTLESFENRLKHSFQGGSINAIIDVTPSISEEVISKLKKNGFKVFSEEVNGVVEIDIEI